MKRNLALLMVVLLGLGLLGGCGGKTDDTDDPGTPAQGTRLQYEYFSFEEAGGWKFYEKVGSVTLTNEGIEDAELELLPVTVNTPEEELEWYLEREQYSQGENVTYGGIEYFVVSEVERGRTFLITAKATPMPDDDEQLQFVLKVTIDEATAAQAAPVLETLKMNDKKMELTYEWPESADVDEEDFSFTVKGGWYQHDLYDRPYAWTTPLDLQNDDISYTAAYMEIRSSIETPEECIASYLEDDDDAKALENVTIAGIEYLAAANEDEEDIFLAAPAGTGSLTIAIDGAAIEDAMPVLETMKIK